LSWTRTFGHPKPSGSGTRFDVVSILAAVAVAVGVLGAGPGAAWATDCSPVHRQVEGADDFPSDVGNLLGIHSTILVNDFDSPQCDTNRSIFVIHNSDNWLELGWIKATDQHVVYWNRREDGMTNPHVTDYTPPGGVDRDFKISNGNQDHNWQIIYGGETINDSAHQSYTVGHLVLTNSEKHGASDNLFAHFDHIQVCTTQTNCNFDDPSDIRKYYDNSDGWDWCKDSKTEHYVRMQCG
jgi:hypothetical protein